MKIRLETRDGRFVAEKEIPPFQILPEVVLWGERFFALTPQPEVKMGTTPIYREVCCFVIVE